MAEKNQPAEQLPQLPRIGELVGGRFRITAKIGSGGFGTVFRAIQENVGRDVALKFLSPRIARDPVNIERFRREALHISQLRHPNTITLYDYGQTESGLFYMVMELLEGISLSDDIQQNGAVEAPRAAHIFLQILKSLTEAHQRGLVHRDLKPENIHLCEMFGEQDYVKVLDFGVAKMTMFEGDDTEEKLTRAGRIFGTPMYMSPEQACAEPITTATDIYALGLLLFEVMTGLPPVTGRNRMDVIQKQIREEVPRLTRKLRGTPLGDVIRHATRKEPSERYADASEMLEAFTDALRREQIVPSPRGATQPSISAFSLMPPEPSGPVIIESVNPEPPLADDASTIGGSGAALMAQLATPGAGVGTAQSEATVVTSIPTSLGAPDAADEATVITENPFLARKGAGPKPAAPAPQPPAVAVAPPAPGAAPEPASAPEPETLRPSSSVKSLAEPTASIEAPEPIHLPFIGREQDVTRLLEFFEEMQSRRQGKLALIEGERGVGKTRLTRELRAALQEQGIFSGVGAFRRRGLALDALREAIADIWGASSQDSPQLRQTLENSISGILPQQEIDFLISFLRPHSDEEVRSSLNSTEETNSLFARLERNLLALVQVRPLIFVFEDLQESDSATLAFLEYLAITLRAQPAPMGFVLTWGTGGKVLSSTQEQSMRAITGQLGQGFLRVRLRRLRERPLSVLLDAILPLEARLKDRIAWLSQGNPMHAIQIVRYLQAGNALIPDAHGRWSLRDGSPRQIELPPNLVHLMQWRVRQAIEGHPEHTGLDATVYWLAVLGLRVPVELVSAVLAQHSGLSSDQVLNNLEVLRRFELINQTSHQNLLCAEFDNSLLREALMRDLEPEMLRSMHLAAAELKERFYTSRRVDPPALEIAEHWRMAGDDDRYRDALFTAAQRSMNGHDPRGAREQFSELLRMLEQRNERGTMWASSLLALAELGRRFGEFGLAEDFYKQAIEANVLTGENAARAERGLAHLFFIMARYAEAVRHYRKALGWSTNEQDKSGVAKALIGLSRVHLRQGDPGAGQKVRTRLKATLNELPSAELAGKVLLHLAEAEQRLGNMTARQDFLQRALESFKKTDDRQGLSDALIELGGALMIPGEDTPARLEEASRVLREALDIKRSIGDRHGVAEIFRNLGHLSVEFEDFEAAEHYYLQSLRMHEALGAVFHIGAVHNAIGIARMMMGDLKGAEQSLERAGRLFDRVGDRIASSHVLLNRGTLALNRGDLDGAETLLTESRTIKEKLDTTWALYDLYNHLAIIAMFRGDRAEAEQLLQRTLDSRTDDSADEDRAVARSLVGLLCALESRLQMAMLELGRARADAEDLGQQRILTLCQANAAFFSALSGDEAGFERLSSGLKKGLFYTLLPEVWIKLLATTTRQSAEDEPSRQSVRQLRAAAKMARALELTEEADALDGEADEVEEGLS